jgi:molybdopterin synthase catalytic subunit
MCDLVTKTKSDIEVQRNFRTTFNKDPPSRPSIRKWLKNFMETGSVDVAHHSGILRSTEHTFSVTASCASRTAGVTHIQYVL